MDIFIQIYEIFDRIYFLDIQIIRSIGICYSIIFNIARKFNVFFTLAMGISGVISFPISTSVLNCSRMCA